MEALVSVEDINSLKEFIDISKKEEQEKQSITQSWSQGDIFDVDKNRQAAKRIEILPLMKIRTLHAPQSAG